MIDAASMSVTATWPVGVRPRGITLSKDGKYIYVCASGDHSVQVIDRATGKIVAELAFRPGSGAIFLSNDGNTLFVANEDDAALTAIDLPARKVDFQVTVGGEPEGVAQSPDGKWVAVTSEEDNVVNWIDLATRQMIDETPTGSSPPSRRVHRRQQGAMDRGRSRGHGSDCRCCHAQDRRNCRVRNSRRPGCTRCFRAASALPPTARCRRHRAWPR